MFANNAYAVEVAYVNMENNVNGAYNAVVVVCVNMEDNALNANNVVVVAYVNTKNNVLNANNVVVTYVDTESDMNDAYTVVVVGICEHGR